MVERSSHTFCSNPISIVSKNDYLCIMTTLDDIRNLRISDYDYPLPDERIARHPLEQREQCKLLFWRQGHIEDHRFSDVPRLLPEGAMLIYNNTRVINARLRFRKWSRWTGRPSRCVPLVVSAVATHGLLTLTGMDTM